MSKLSKIMKSVLQTYIIIGFAYGMWAFLILSFRETCLLSVCEPLPQYNSLIINAAISLLPDETPYALLIAFGRGSFWLPNLYFAIFTDQLSLYEWVFLRGDVPSMREFYSTLDKILS